MTFKTTTVWTDDKRQLLRKLRDQGVPIADIAIRLGISESAVCRELNKQGLSQRVRPLGGTRSPEKIAEIEGLLREGLSSSETATRAHVDRVFVVALRSTLGLPPHVKRPPPPVKRRQKFVFGRALKRPPPGAFPGTDSVAEFIATRGVTLCPAAAAAGTTAVISAADQEALAAYQRAKDEAWAADIAPRQAKALAGLRAANAARSRA